MANIFFSLVFIASTLFLLAGGVVLGESSARLAKIATRFAPLMLLMLTRSYLEKISGWLKPLISKDQLVLVMDVFYYALPLIAAILLWRLAARTWDELRPVAVMEPVLAS